MSGGGGGGTRRGNNVCYEMREGSGKRKRGEGGVDEEKDDGRSRPCKGKVRWRMSDED